MGTLVTAEEIARLIGVTRRTISAWARKGKIPRIKITGKVVRFDPDQVVRALKSRATDEPGGRR